MLLAIVRGKMPIVQPGKVIESLQLCAKESESRQEMLQATADAVRNAGSPYTSVYLYMLNRDGKELVLEAFSGRETEHKRIAVGCGVCGTAVAEGEDQNVGDVAARANYIACNLFTKSELVVLIRDKEGRILGQIDVDSDVLDPFDAEEEAALRTVADALGSLLPKGSD